MSKSEALTPEASQKSTFDELRQRTYTMMILFVSAGAATLLWLGNVEAHTSTPRVVALWLGVEAICGLSWLLHRHHVPLASAIAIGGFWLFNATGFFLLNLPIFAYVFALIALLAGVVMNRFAGVVISVISTAFLLLIHDSTITSDSLFPVLMIWITLMTSLVAFYSLYQALDVAWSYEDYAVKQMSEAREHRATLMQLTKTLNEMRQDLERVNTQLAHAYRVAEEARRLKAQFAANVSHELRTPINLIVGFSETIVQSPDAYGMPMPPVYWADMHTIYRSAKHLQSLINDVLDVSQIEAGKMTIIKEEVDSGQVFMEAANLARDLIESRGLTFDVHLMRSMPALYLDRVRIRQVVLNLLSNAARFTNSGTITLSARIVESELWITVKDTGIGIPPADLNRVFEEFHQVEGSLSRKHGGTGLGLTLSKHFVELHGGRIWAESEGIPGRGSTFIFTLPLLVHHQYAGVPVVSSTSTEPSEDDARYFVVYDDDDAIVQLFMRHVAKHRVVGASRDEDALRLVERIRPAALVMDEQHDHAHIADLLRERNCSTPLITCAMPSTRRALQLLDNVYPLGKPVTADSLHTALERLDIPETILLIAEDLDMIRMLSRLLRAMTQAFTVLKAYSSEEGLALARQQRPGVIILDNIEPKAQETPILQQLQADPLLVNTPILLVSAGSGDELTPARDGRIRVNRSDGFQPLELVRCVEALVGALRPSNAPSYPETRPESAAS